MRRLPKPNGATRHAVTAHMREGRSLDLYAMDVSIEDGWLILTHAKGDTFTTHAVARIDIKH